MGQNEKPFEYPHQILIFARQKEFALDNQKYSWYLKKDWLILYFLQQSNWWEYEKVKYPVWFEMKNN